MPLGQILYKTVDPEELSLEISQFLAIPGMQIRKVTRCSVLGKGVGGIGGFFPYRKGRHCFKEKSMKTLEEKQTLLSDKITRSPTSSFFLIQPIVHRIAV